ncbi:hypothetical protein B0H19DRAFT_1265778 [Mycena capillaripes]|nr:hypothetical protein B0H19DRAFT_1265778 [Mycena capillaripes]
MSSPLIFPPDVTPTPSTGTPTLPHIDTPPAPPAGDALRTPPAGTPQAEGPVRHPGDTPDLTPVVRPPIIQRSKEKRPRHTKGAPKARPGKPSWVWGTKKVFFERRKDDWVRESEADRAGEFYTKVAKLYLKKYPWDLADNEDYAFDFEDPPDSAADEVVHEVLDPEIEKTRVESMKTLRSRIGQWYRTEYGSLIRSDKVAFKELFTGVLDGTPAKPQRGRLIHFYSRKYYETRIKPVVQERMEALKRRAEFTGETMPKNIDVISKVTSEMWEGEVPSFKHECELAAEREYQQQLVAWQATQPDAPTRTPEELAATLDNAGFYLQPFVDAIQERFGMCATLLLAGPVGIQQGKMGLVSVHAGATKGIAPMKWPAYDWHGFQEVERLMLGFARECFSDAECALRALALPPGHLPPPRMPLASGSSASESARGSSILSTSGGVNSAASLGLQPSQAPPPLQAPLLLQAPLSDVPMTVPADGEERQEGEDHEGGEACNKNGGEAGTGTRRIRARKKWGSEWELCTRKYFNFEGAWGFVEGSWKMQGRPRQVSGWVARGRKWGLPPALGGLLGRRAATGMASELWVGSWWTWWRSLQPEERVALDNGDLSRPETADWSKVAKMYGNNGLMLIMAALAWWGEVVQKREEEEQEEWRMAVRDVTWVLEELLKSGEIRKNAGDLEETDNDEQDEQETEEVQGKGGKRKRAAVTGKKKKNEKNAGEGGDEAAGPPKKRVRRKAATADPAPHRTSRRTEEGRQTRSAGGSGAQTKGKQVQRPKPKPIYRKKGGA